jgi:hypothetical protein
MFLGFQMFLMNMSVFGAVVVEFIRTIGTVMNPSFGYVNVNSLQMNGQNLFAPKFSTAFVTAIA